MKIFELLLLTSMLQQKQLIEREEKLRKARDYPNCPQLLKNITKIKHVYACKLVEDRLKDLFFRILLGFII